MQVRLVESSPTQNNSASTSTFRNLGVLASFSALHTFPNPPPGCDLASLEELRYLKYLPQIRSLRALNALRALSSLATLGGESKTLKGLRDIEFDLDDDMTPKALKAAATSLSLLSYYSSLRNVHPHLVHLDKLQVLSRLRENDAMSNVAAILPSLRALGALAELRFINTVFADFSIFVETFSH